MSDGRNVVPQADAIRVKVGFPTSPNTTDARSVASYYSLVEIDEKQFVKNMLSAA
jgi:endothelin-converting enzyme